MKAAVVGVGNLLVADDGIGIRIARELQALLADARVDCVESERGGLDILEFLEGTGGSVIVDAARTERCPPGTVTRFILRKPFVPGACPSLHALSIDAVLSLGESAGMDLPEEVTLYTIEAADIEHFGRGCTEAVEAAIPSVVSRVLHDLQILFPDIACARGYKRTGCMASLE